MKFSLTIAAAVSALQAPIATPAAQHADLVVRNAQIYTVESAQPSARALAVRSGRISFIGTSEDVASHIGPSTRVVEAANRFIMSGFHDATST